MRTRSAETRFSSQANDDAIGYNTPLGSHIRRMNPRDADVAGLVRIHRMIRRGTAYGPPLPHGVLEDDGADRGLVFAFVGANIGRQFEFVQSEWMNESSFFGGTSGKDPVSGSGGEPGTFDIPKRPVKMKLQGLPQFVVTRGGEYCFLPGLRALRWLAELQAMIGLAAGGGSPALLPRLLPPGRALQMLMTGDPISAAEAYRLGMVNEIHPQGPLDAALRIAEKIAGNSPPPFRLRSAPFASARVSRSSRPSPS